MKAVTLHEITRETVRSICDLHVSKEQGKCVASNAISIAESYFSKEAWLSAIYADETPVGFVMLWENESKGEYFLGRVMIDEKYRKQRYGAKALELSIQHVREIQNAKALHLGYHEDEGSPRKFYEKFGFVDTREQTDNGEYVMTLKLSVLVG